jgi:stearoyl-CoA desaturase (Delta-9 desaturase)
MFMNVSMTLHDAILNMLVNGWLALSWWQIILVTLLLTHITIASVTIYLHRSQAHRSLDLHPVAYHFFRFWLWLTTGMVTKEWVAIHRKHHAKCETKEDPHSPQILGIHQVLWAGAELYRAEANHQETLQSYGHQTPDDILERGLYARFNRLGIFLMLALDLCLFGALGLTVWAVQMAWIPFTAAGVINGLGHWWGYRNFEVADASTNLSPWGILIGGEELHNNHHTYPTSAKLSIKPYEFDIGWIYISALQFVKLAKVRKTPPSLKMGKLKSVADSQTLEAIVANRYEVMAKYAKQLRKACRMEFDDFDQKDTQNAAGRLNLKIATRWLHRDANKIPASAQASLDDLCAQNPRLAKWVAMREELRQLWTSSNATVEQLVMDLQNWCHKAEESGIAALQEFSLKLRAVHA